MTLSKTQQSEKVRKIIKPVFDRMLLEPVSMVKKTGGLHVPDDVAKTAISMCKVLAVGPGKLNAETNTHLQMTAKPGDLVYANTMLGNKITAPQSMELVVVSPDGSEIVLEPGKEYILQNEDTIYANLE